MWLVGPSQFVWGLCISVSSVVAGRVATKIPRTFLVVVGALGDASVILFLIFWERVPSYAVVFVMSIVFGVGLGVWNTAPASECLRLLHQHFQYICIVHNVYNSVQNKVYNYYLVPINTHVFDRVRKSDTHFYRSFLPTFSPSLSFLCCLLHLYVRLLRCRC